MGEGGTLAALSCFIFMIRLARQAVFYLSYSLMSLMNIIHFQHF